MDARWAGGTRFLLRHIRHRRTQGTTTQTDRQTDRRRTDRQTDEQTDRQTDRQRDRHVKNVEISVIRCLFKTNFSLLPKNFRASSHTRAPCLTQVLESLFVPRTLSRSLTHPSFFFIYAPPPIDLHQPPASFAPRTATRQNDNNPR